MSTPTLGEIRPNSDPFSDAFRQLAVSTGIARCFLDLAADFHHLPGARDVGRLRAVARNLADLGAELDTLLASLEDAQRSDGGSA